MTLYRRRMNERELALLPNPLSGIAQKSPLPASSSAEKPPTGWVAPGAGAGSVLITPANGAGKAASAGRIARASSLTFCGARSRGEHRGQGQRGGEESLHARHPITCGATRKSTAGETAYGFLTRMNS